MNERLSFYADFWSYSQEACLDTCRQVDRIKQVGCCMPPLPCNPLHREEIFQVKLPANLTYCPPEVYTEGSLERQLLYEFDKLPAYCKQLCPRPCEKVVWDYVPTIREFPLEHGEYEREFYLKNYDTDEIFWSYKR